MFFAAVALIYLMCRVGIRLALGIDTGLKGVGVLVRMTSTISENAGASNIPSGGRACSLGNGAEGDQDERSSRFCSTASGCCRERAKSYPASLPDVTIAIITTWRPAYD